MTFLDMKSIRKKRHNYTKNTPLSQSVSVKALCNADNLFFCLSYALPCQALCIYTSIVQGLSNVLYCRKYARKTQSHTKQKDRPDGF